jgi:nitroreductase
MSIRELVLSTRSYRRFDPEVSVDCQILRELVDLARLSASAANRQPLKYILSCSAEDNARVFPYTRWAGALKDWAGPAQGERPAAYIVILGNAEISNNVGCDHGIAAQSIMLGATERGLGGCMIGALDRPGLRASLRIPERYDILLVLALGRPAEQVVLEELPPNGNINYWRDENSVHHVPKRALDDVILRQAELGHGLSALSGEEPVEGPSQPQADAGVVQARTNQPTRPDGVDNSPPYSPSWVDRLTAWLSRLPGPSWSYCLGLGLVLLALFFTVLWIEGICPMGTVLPSHVFIAAMVPCFLGLFHCLDDRATEALAALRPVLKVSDREYCRLHYRLGTLPRLPTLLASLAWVIVVVLGMVGGAFDMPRAYRVLVDAPVSRVLLHGMSLVTLWVVGAFLYHTVHQLGVIHRIYARHTCVNLFTVRPLYAFSGVAALTSVALTASFYGWIALNPGMLDDPVAAFGVALPWTVSALVSFAWPFLGVHRLLVREKERALGEAALRLDATVNELHRQIDSGRLEGMGDLNRAIASLEVEQNLLRKVPTWPWRPEAVRLLVTALLIPFLLWIGQYLLQRRLGP